MAAADGAAVKTLGAGARPGGGASVRVVDLLSGVRAACLRLPEVTERLSHGAPGFFVRGKKTFVMVMVDGHHHNEFPHLWCAYRAVAPRSLINALDCDNSDQSRG